MNTDVIHTAFETLIAERAVHTKLGISSDAVRSLRAKLKDGRGITTDRKLELLQKSGWRQDDHQYNRQDLVSLAKFILKSSAAAKEHGAQYLVDKWTKSQTAGAVHTRSGQ